MKTEEKTNAIGAIVIAINTIVYGRLASAKRNAFLMVIFTGFSKCDCSGYTYTMNAASTIPVKSMKTLIPAEISTILPPVSIRKSAPYIDKSITLISHITVDCLKFNLKDLKKSFQIYDSSSLVILTVQ